MFLNTLRMLPRMRRAMSENAALKEQLAQWKYGQTFSPGHYYSPVANRDEVEQFQSEVERGTSEIAGIDLRWPDQRTLLNQLSAFYHELPFAPSKENSSGCRYYYDNGFYCYADGIVLYSLLRHLAPRRLIEVGSGFSSCVILDVNERFLNGRIQCTFIEPYPDRLNENLRPDEKASVNIVERKVQLVDLALFDQLQAGDILLIDSSHVSKASSDVNFLMFHVLPRLKPGVWIHVHDVFYPFEYPKQWNLSGRSWNEAYLLRAFLMHNQAYRIRLWCDGLSVHYRNELEQLMPLCLNNTGASIWLEKAVEV